MNAPLSPTPIGQSLADDASRLLQLQRAAFAGDMNPSRAVRLERLGRIEAMLDRDGERFCAAIAEDFGTRDRIVTQMADVLPVRAAIRHARKHLGRWMKTRRAGVELTWLPGHAKIMMQPLGIVGIIGPWNYPLQLVLAPLVGALAAGNRAILKPSELTPAFSAVLKESVAAAFPEDEVAVVVGGPDVAKAFSELSFDHLVFTGSTSVGRLVAQAAAKNLTPVTLELGGKSPVILDATADLRSAADRIAWGKFLNAGQTCIAPDYALVPRAMVTPFVEALRKAVARQYPTVAGNADYTSIVNDRHAARLERLVDEARAGGAEIVELQSTVPAPGSRILPPTVLLGVTPEMAIMQEEIFGPLLPIMPYDTPDEAIAFVNGRDRPLALYWFGTDAAVREKVLSQTISGGVTINDTLIHILQENLPFGGVGPSGQGHYHGEYGFKTLSKAKPVFVQSRFSGGSMIYPPYTGFTRRFVSLLERFG